MAKTARTAVVAMGLVVVGLAATTREAFGDESVGSSIRILVINHEGEHTAVGLMQPYLNQSDFRNAREGRLLFTSEQAEAIRQRAALILATSVTASAQESVRSSQPGLTALIARANMQSQTFRRLSSAVNASDGIVYIEPGFCGHGVAACLTNVTTAGGNRILWVRVDTRKHEIDLIASIGHELRHAIEVLGDPTITTDAAMHLFYVREGVVRRSGAFETSAAVEAGRAVRDEIQKR